jgi:hypothetical protein
MRSARARVTLEIELDSEPIQGSLSHGDGANHAFNGWIELVALLQDAATAAPGAGRRAALAAAPAEDAPR